MDEMERLIAWLPATLPEQTRTSVVHGDYRIDNMIWARDRAQVLAVLDWELSTLGDPLAAFTYVAMAWVTDRKSVVLGESVSVRVALVGSRNLKKEVHKTNHMRDSKNHKNIAKKRDNIKN